MIVHLLVALCMMTPGLTVLNVLLLAASCSCVTLACCHTHGLNIKRSVCVVAANPGLHRNLMDSSRMRIGTDKNNNAVGEGRQPEAPAP